MDGRVSLGDQVVALPALRQGKAQKKGELWHLLLPDRSRGKVVIGDVTVLFQFVTPPPVQPRPQLPPSVRSSLMQNLDWMLVAVVAASFIMHFGFVIYLRNIDWPRKPDIEEIPDRFVQMIVPKKVEEPKPRRRRRRRREEGREEGGEEGQGRAGEEGAGPKPPRIPRPRRGRRPSGARVWRRDVQKMGVLEAARRQGREAARSPISSKAATSRATPTRCSRRSAASAWRGAGGGGLRSPRARAAPARCAAAARCARGGPGEVGTGEKGGERAVKGVVKDSAPTDVDGSLDPSVDRAARSAGASAPSRPATRRASSATRTSAASWQLRFEVSTVGKVTSAEIENDTHARRRGRQLHQVARHDLALPGPRRRQRPVRYPFIFQASK